MCPFRNRRKGTNILILWYVSFLGRRYKYLTRNAPAVFKKNSLVILTQFYCRVNSFFKLLRYADDLVGVDFYAGAHSGGKNAGFDILAF